MNTDIKATSKTDYTEKVLNLTDPRFLAEAENHRFTQRRSPASVWAAAACFTLIFAAACAFLFRPKGERPIEAGPTAVPTATPAPAQRLIFSPGNEFPDYGADVLENYDAIELDYPEGNPYYTGSDAKPLAAKLLLPKGWTVKDGRFDGTGYYPTEEFASYCMPERTGNAVKSIYSESGECVGSIGLAATTAEYPGISNAFAPITMGKGAFRFTDDETASVSSGKNGEAYTGRSQYATTPASSEPLSIELPVLISYDSEFLVGLVIEFGQSAVTDGQLIQIAESVRFALLNTAAAEPATAEPTAAVPTATPFPYSYNREEYETLRDFFLLEDENGVKNGEKCFKGYDPNKVKFWGPEPDGDADESRLIWNDDGNPWGSTLNSIILEGLSDETRLVGSIRLDKFSSLKEFSANRIIFESLNADIRNSFDTNSIGDNTVSFGCEGDAVLIADYITQFNIASFSHCRYESTGEVHGGALAFTADLTADGSGFVGVRGYMDTHYYIVYVYAEPKEGNEFIGWYDADGKLISTEAEIELSYSHDTGWSVHDFTAAARFEPVQSVLKTDPWYLEKAWEYAEFANREYGFRFDKNEWSVKEHLNAISFSYPGSSEDFAGAALTVRFIEGKKEVYCADIYNDEASDAPVDYASLSEEELKRLHNESMLVNSYTVTPHDMENAGYTLDGTDLDYVKVAEYCARINAERLTGCSENNYELCREVDIGNVFIQMMGSDPDIVYCCAAYYFLPAYPLSFLSGSMDMVCNLIAPDDAEHPGWLTYDMMCCVNITKTADGWECHTGFPDYAIGTNDPLVANPRYLEKAWEYAEFANREYGFSFVKYYWEPSDNAIVFRASKPGMNNRQNLYVFFHERNGEEIIEPLLMGDSSDIPAGYSELGEAEREAIDKEIANLPEYHVTPQDMLQAGYTLDGTEQDYIKIAEYCGRRYAAMFTGCSEINPQFCREAEAVNARRTEWMLDSTRPIYCLVSYYFRPAYPLYFTDRHGDIGCGMNLLDDAEHPGWICFTGDVLITEADNGWKCEIAFISGY